MQRESPLEYNKNLNEYAGHKDRKAALAWVGAVSGGENLKASCGAMSCRTEGVECYLQYKRYNAITTHIKVMAWRQHNNQIKKTHKKQMKKDINTIRNTKKKKKQNENSYTSTVRLCGCATLGLCSAASVIANLQAHLCEHSIYTNCTYIYIYTWVYSYKHTQYEVNRVAFALLAVWKKY